MPLLRLLLSLATATLLTACVAAQPKTPLSAELKKKDQKELAAAQSDASLGKFTAAADRYDALISRYPDQARLFYLRSVTKKNRGDLTGAIADIQAGMQRESQVSGVTLKELASLQSKSGQFAEALRTTETYAASDYANARPQRKEAAQELLTRARVAARLAASPVPFTPEALGDGINTPDNMEYFPSVSVDGQRMIFTRRVANEQEDFYLSDRLEDGSWSAAVPLAGVNTGFNEGAQTITADGRLLVFTACDRPEGAGSCDLYYTEQDEEGRWSKARNVGPTVNTRDYEAQPSLSADGTFLFFASRRPGGFGNTDIYVSRRTPSGKWSAPANLGPTINTKGKEEYPYFSADGATLFFTSNEHPGLGGADIFRSSLDATGQWSAPENIGYPINTAADETNLFIELSGETAYFSKGQTNAETGRMDVNIYRFDLPEENRPAPATYVRARVTDAQTGEPLVVDVRLRPLLQAAPPVVRQTGRQGTFTTVLPAGRDYALTVDQGGYLFYSDRFLLTDSATAARPYLLDIALEPVSVAGPVASDRAEADGAIAFRNVLFETGSADLLPVSGDELDRLAALLQTVPRFGVEIVGHTDNVGAEGDNQLLSERRATAVKTYLVSKGIDQERITTRGAGENSPVADNATPEGRARNRRTTFRLEE